MKMSIIGGGGVRTAFFAETVARHCERLGITELAIMDNNPMKLKVYGELAKYAAFAVDSRLTVELTDDFKQAVTGAKYVVTTLRVGGDEGRILDERIAIRNGTIGQETTGPGGFSFSLRTIPVMLEYCRIIEQVAPDATVFNFTNPSGLVTQAMHTNGYYNVIGICDGPTHMKSELADTIGVNLDDVFMRIYGLNHLSFTNSVLIKGKEILPELLCCDAFLKRTHEFKHFDPELIRSIGSLPNNYLYYFYYREKALRNLLNAPRTRGETILEINREMFAQMTSPAFTQNRAVAMKAYRAFFEERERTYMSIEAGDAPNNDEDIDFKARFGLTDLNLTPGKGETLEGYSGVALNYIEAVANNTGIDLPLSVRNQGAIGFLRDEDVVEITCTIDKNGAHPVRIPLDTVPDGNRLLIEQVKLYERLTVEAVHKKSKMVAIEALMNHPLVGSYSTARALVNEYLNAFADYFKGWN